MFTPYSPDISQDQEAPYFSQPIMQEQQYPQPTMTMPQFEPMQTPYSLNQNTDAAADARSAMIMPDDPPPRLSNNRVTANVVLFKELTAYPNYGNPSRNADILYTGNVGTWTFDSPAFLFRATKELKSGYAPCWTTMRAYRSIATQQELRLTVLSCITEEWPLTTEHL